MNTIVANWQPNTDRARDLNIPEGLSEQGKKAYEIIIEYLRALDLTDTGGCKAFYAPEQWRLRDGQYGLKSLLVVVYDGGDLRPVFNMDAAYDLDCRIVIENGGTPPAGYTPYSLYETMQAKLRAAGMYFEECTGWYCAVYSEQRDDGKAPWELREGDEA